MRIASLNACGLPPSLHADGGPITQAANNYPLRGGKHSHFDGGVRVATFVSGGWLPAAQRGKRVDALVAIEDWYKTFGVLGGLSEAQIEDKAAAAASLPPIDSVDVSPLLLGSAGASAPRTAVPMGSCANAHKDVFCQGEDPGATVVSGVVASVDGALYKLLVGWVPLDCTTDPAYPPANGSHANCPWRDCGSRGCLYNLTRDETESNDLLQTSQPEPPPPAILGALRTQLSASNATVFSPNRGKDAVDRACDAAIKRGWFWGPFAQTVGHAAGPS